jgi:hypothetical protein
LTVEFTARRKVVVVAVEKPAIGSKRIGGWLCQLVNEHDAEYHDYHTRQHAEDKPDIDRQVDIDHEAG